METQVLAVQPGFTFNSCARTLNAVLKTYLEGWSIEIDGEKKSRESVIKLI